MKQVITCINCPVGCRMTVMLDANGSFVSVSGNTCPRGARYAQQECIAPERMITAVIPVFGSAIPLSVKTAAPIPKKLIPFVMEKILSVQLSAPIIAGDVVIRNVLETGVDIIATRSIE